MQKHCNATYTPLDFESLLGHLRLTGCSAGCGWAALVDGINAANKQQMTGKLQQRQALSIN